RGHEILDSEKMLSFIGNRANEHGFQQVYRCGCSGRACAPQGSELGACYRLLSWCVGLRGGLTIRRRGGISLSGRLSSSYRVKHLGKRGWSGSSSRHDRAVSRRVPLSHPRTARGCAQSIDEGKDSIGRCFGSWRKRSTLFARSGRQWGRTLFGSAKGKMATDAGWKDYLVHAAARSRWAAGGGSIYQKLIFNPFGWSY